MILTTIESCRPDETLCSMIGRALAHSTFNDRKQVGFEVTGQYGADIHLELPMHISAVARRMGHRIGMTANDLIAQTTALPLYAPFLSRKRWTMVKVAMMRGNTTPYTLLGLHADPTQAAQWLRFCPECRRYDQQRHGYSWWRRIHQARGVIHCPKHKVQLLDSQFRRNGAWQVDYPLADDAVGTAPRNEITSTLPLIVARDTHWLLSANLQPNSPEAIRSAYIEAASKQGFVKHGRLQRTDLLHELASSIGSDALRFFGLSFEPDSPYSWPAKLIMVPQVLHPPLRHIALINFLGLDIKAFIDLVVAKSARRKGSWKNKITQRALIKRLWRVREISLNEIARRSGLNQATVRTWASSMDLTIPRFPTKLQRHQFLLLRQNIRRMFLRSECNTHLNRNRFKWLSRNDSAWFNKNLQRKRRSGPARVDWAARDAKLAHELPNATDRLRAYRPFRRVSIMGLADELQCVGALLGSAGRLPKFEVMAGQFVEDARSFALRRIRTIKRERPDLPKWRIRELASVPRPLLQDPAVRRAIDCNYFSFGIGNHHRS